MYQGINTNGLIIGTLLYIPQGGVVVQGRTNYNAVSYVESPFIPNNIQYFNSRSGAPMAIRCALSGGFPPYDSLICG